MSIKWIFVYGFTVGAGTLILSIIDLTKKIDIGNIITLIFGLATAVISVVAFIDVHMYERELRGPSAPRK